MKDEIYIINGKYEIILKVNTKLHILILNFNNSFLKIVHIFIYEWLISFFYEVSTFWCMMIYRDIFLYL